MTKHGTFIIKTITSRESPRERQYIPHRVHGSRNSTKFVRAQMMPFQAPEAAYGSLQGLAFPSPQVFALASPDLFPMPPSLPFGMRMYYSVLLYQKFVLWFLGSTGSTAKKLPWVLEETLGFWTCWYCQDCRDFWVELGVFFIMRWSWTYWAGGGRLLFEWEMSP